MTSISHIVFTSASPDASFSIEKPDDSSQSMMPFAAYGDEYGYHTMISIIGLHHPCWHKDDIKTRIQWERDKIEADKEADLIRASLAASAPHSQHAGQDIREEPRRL